MKMIAARLYMYFPYYGEISKNNTLLKAVTNKLMLDPIPNVLGYWIV